MRMHFFFNDTATTEIYTLSLHDALPISPATKVFAFEPSEDGLGQLKSNLALNGLVETPRLEIIAKCVRSEEHTSELQSHLNLVCRLLLEKKTDADVSSAAPTTIGTATLG